MRKLHIHVGLAKTGTTFLQEVVFPRSAFCYLGKTSDIHRESRLDSDPFMFFKYLLNENSGSCFAKMPVAKDKIKQFSGLYSYYQNMIKEEQMLLMSDESFTVNPLNRFMRFIVKRCAEVVGELEDQEACYRNGFSLSEYLLGSRDQLSQSFKEQLIASNTISFKIQRCLDALGAELGGILLVNRDFGSWFASYFLQFVKAERENLGHLEGTLSPQLLFTIAGCVVCCDRFLKDHDRSGFVFASSFASCIERNFGSEVLKVVSYSPSPSIFCENLRPVLQSYGIKPSVLEKVCKLEMRKNETRVGPLIFRGEAEIIRLRDKFSTILNNLVDIK